MSPENETKNDEKESRIPTVPAVEQASRVLICLARDKSSRMNLTEVCRKVGIHKSKGYSILNTLQKFGFVQRDPENKLYSLGPGLISLSRKVLDTLDYRAVVGPFLEGLAVETKSTALFGVIADGNFFIVAKHEGNQDFGVTMRLGFRFPITAGAHGKAVVSFMPEEERRTILSSKKLFFHGDPENLDRERLRSEFENCRKSGYAFDVGGLHPGINAIASPVAGAGGKLIGALLVIGTFAEAKIGELGATVAKEARSVSLMLGGNV
jgi:DNA-binding IclR family transcriptional regulator